MQHLEREQIDPPKLASSHFLFSVQSFQLKTFAIMFNYSSSNPYITCQFIFILLSLPLQCLLYVFPPSHFHSHDFHRSPHLLLT